MVITQRWVFFSTHTSKNIFIFQRTSIYYPTVRHIQIQFRKHLTPRLRRQCPAQTIVSVIRLWASRVYFQWRQHRKNDQRTQFEQNIIRRLLSGCVQSIGYESGCVCLCVGEGALWFWSPEKALIELFWGASGLNSPTWLDPSIQLFPNEHRLSRFSFSFKQSFIRAKFSCEHWRLATLWTYVFTIYKLYLIYFKNYKYLNIIT